MISDQTVLLDLYVIHIEPIDVEMIQFFSQDWTVQIQVIESFINH